MGARVAPISRGVWFFAALALLLALSSVVVVAENEQVVIERMGTPVRVVNRFRSDGQSGAGLAFKLPFVEQAVVLSRGLKGYSAGGQKVRSADAQDLLIDADVTYRIIDPVRLAKRLGAPQSLENELGRLVGPMLSGKLSDLSAATIAQPGSGGVARQLRTELDQQARQLGIQIVDFRVGRVNFAETSLQAAYDVMQARHLREVDAIDAERFASAKRTRAEVDAEKATILQASAGRDPEFYDFWRAMRSYAAVFENPDPKRPATIVIPPDSSYLRHLNRR